MQSISYIDIGKRIRAARKQQSMTQEELAEQTNLSVAHISHIETANTKLSLSALINIANALNVTSDSLLCDNMKNRSNAANNHLSSLICDCSDQEIRIITDIVESTKQTLKKHYY